MNVKVIISFDIAVKINVVRWKTFLKNVYVKTWFLSEKMNGA